MRKCIDPTRLGHGAAGFQSLWIVVVCRQVYLPVVLNETETNSIEPASAPQYVLDDGWVSKEVDHRIGDHSKNVDFELVAKRVEDAVCRPESRLHAARKIKTQCGGVCALKQAKRSARVDTGH